MATGSKNGQTKKKPAGRKKPAAKKYNNKSPFNILPFLSIIMALSPSPSKDTAIS